MIIMNVFVKKQLKIEREIFKEKLDIAIKKRQEVIDKENIKKERKKIKLTRKKRLLNNEGRIKE